MQKYVISAIVLIVLVVIFALQNAAPVLVKFYFWDFNMALALLIIGSASAGFVLGTLIRLGKKKGNNEVAKNESI